MVVVQELHFELERKEQQEEMLKQMERVGQALQEVIELN